MHLADCFLERLVDRCLGGGKGLQAEQRERRDGGLLLGNGVGLLSLVERRRIRGWLWGVLRLIPKRQDVLAPVETSMCVYSTYYVGADEEDDR